MTSLHILRAAACGSRLALAAALALPLAVACPGAAQAQTDTAEKPFSIAAGDLAAALRAYSNTTGIQLVYSSELVQGLKSPGVSGRMTPAQAMTQLLAGTGLTAQISGNSATIMRTDAQDGERLTSAVRVQGTQGSPYFGGAGVAAGVNGTNGSRDITATEGTGSFTSGALTIGSKVPQAIKDVPQSLSVLTNTRLEQQNITDFTNALKQLPGVTVAQASYLGTNLNQSFYSRGFQISGVQVDGGAPLKFGASYSPQIDMSVYDHIELLRGAAGLFNGYGDPGGTINLVRKKPLDHPQYVLEAQAGSWSNYRVVADATAPLAFDGRLRGRLVMTYQDSHHFFKVAKDNKILIYGIAEFDLTPTTLISGGINYTKQDSTPWFGGLPRYQTGADLGLPRSTSFVFPWNRQNFDTTELFGSIEQRIGQEWTLKISATDVRQQDSQKVGTVINAVDPATNQGPALYGYYYDFNSQRFSAEAVLTGAFELFGQRQEITIGANRASDNADGSKWYNDLVRSRPSAPYQPYPNGPRYCYDFFGGCPAGTIAPATPPINVFNFNAYDPIYSEPPQPLANTRFNAQGTIQSGVYINARFTAFDRLHLQTGLRWSRYESKYDQDSLCWRASDCPGQPLGSVVDNSKTFYGDDDFSWPPPVNLSFDVTKQLTAYLGYTDIYQSQSRSVSIDLKPIDPVTGSNLEAGVKWAAHGGRLNVSLAAYSIKQKGFGTLDGATDFSTGEFVASNGKRFPNYGQIDPIHTCCFKADPNNTLKSQGFDLEATGEVLPGWQVSASYTYSENERQGSSSGTAQGQPFVSIQPKNLYKVWMSYDFGAAGTAGLLSRLTVSGGMNGQSSGYFQGSGCKPGFITTDSFSGAPACAAGGSYSYNYTVAPYAVFSGRLDYRVSDKWSLALNLDNILDKVYYEGVGDVTGGNWYGTPRSVMATVRAKW